MSALVGVFWRTAERKRAALGAYEILMRAIRPLADASTLTEVRLDSAIFLKTDFGIYDSSGLLSDEKSVSAICGHPHIDHLQTQPRSAHLKFLADAALGERIADFAEARGTYSFVAADVDGGRLTLATDCLGIRPLYYSDHDGIVIFSSTLTALQRLGEKVLGPRDERGAVEAAVFGFSLRDRTPWLNVRCVSAGCVVVFSKDRTEHARYWSMSDVPPARDDSEQDGLEAVFRAFSDAVTVRAAGKSVVAAQLSGGMDSRAVVALLRSLKRVVYSVNFATPGSQDLVYGRKVADALGCIHTEVPMAGGSVVDDMRTVLERLRRNPETREAFGTKASMVWSGDGGSVTLGHVYLTESMTAAAEAGNYKDAINSLLIDQCWVVPKGVLRGERVGELIEYPSRGLFEVLSECHSADAGRRLHMLLMSTDQRRHLHPHFELIYEHRCDLQVPFYDRKLVEAVVRRPIRPFLYHRFYNRWFELLPKAATSVPWQAYPGHEACPVQSTEDLVYQWTREAMSARQQMERRRYVAKAARALLQGKFEGTAVSSRRTAIALAATALGIRDLTYALRFSSILAKD